MLDEKYIFLLIVYVAFVVCKYIGVDDYEKLNGPKAKGCRRVGTKDQRVYIEVSIHDSNNNTEAEITNTASKVQVLLNCRFHQKGRH